MESTTLPNISSHPKPAILCLHGGGTNSEIFTIQMVRLHRALDPYFTFIYLDGPLESDAGPGVMPVFEGLGPFRRWYVRGPVGSDDLKPEVTARVLQDAMEAQRRKDGRGFVGAVGFSQGAKTVAGLLLEQQVREEKGESVKGEGLAFGVLFNSTSSPLVGSGLTDEERGQRISIPSLHVVGADDPWREEGLEMFGEHFDQKKARLMEFKVDHRLPVLEEDNLRVKGEILRMFRDAEQHGNLAELVG